MPAKRLNSCSQLKKGVPMVKLKSGEQLDKYCEDILKKARKVPMIAISSGTCGQARGSLKLIEAFQDAVKEIKG